MSETNEIDTETGDSTEEFLDSQDTMDQEERLEDQSDEVDWSDVPTQKKPESLYALFNKVWRSRDNSKVANLDKYELGPQPIMNVRNAQFLSLIGAVVRHNSFSQFFMNLSEITLKTSASKKGWFTELFVSQKKQTTRFAGMPFGEQQDHQQFKTKKRFNLFGGGSAEKVEGGG